MLALLLIAIVLVGVAVALAIGSTAEAGTSARLDVYGYQLPRDVRTAPRRPATMRALERLVGGLGRTVRGPLLGGSEQEATAFLRGAGLYRLTPTAYVALRLAALAAAFVLWLVVWAEGTATLPAVVVGAVLLACAWLLPPAELRRRRAARLDRVDRGLADLVDFLVVTVEAGVGLGAALTAAAQRFKGPLGEELRLTVHEQNMGLSTEEALHNLLARCDTAIVRSFVRSVLQAEMLGVSIGQILRGLAVEMRTRRRQAAEERAHKAPVKIVFPLVLLILPALFLVILGPAAYNVMKAF